MKIFPIRFQWGKTPWFVNVIHPRCIMPIRHEYRLCFERMYVRDVRFYYHVLIIGRLRVSFGVVSPAKRAA